MKMITQISKTIMRIRKEITEIKRSGLHRLNTKALVFIWCLISGIFLSVLAHAEWNPTHPDPILEYHYTYDQMGNITVIYDQVKVSSCTFTYDEVNRLTQATGQYGAGGTQQSQSYSYNAVGDIQNVPIPVTYPSDNGNIIDYNGKHIDYDYENRPIKITDNTNNTITEFSYDYSGQRMWKKVKQLSGQPVSETYYIGNIYEETVADGSTTTVKYIYAGSMRAASIVNAGSGSNTYYYLPDHLGSTNLMTNVLGDTVQTISYEPWGSTVEFSSSTYNSPYKFTGQMLDDSTELYYYGARYYDPSLKRFISPDSIIQDWYDPQTLNRYAYTRNNPLKYIDPTGHEVIYAETGGEYDLFRTYYFRTGNIFLDYSFVGAFNELRNLSAYSLNLGLNVLGGIEQIERLALENSFIEGLFGSNPVEGFNAAIAYFGATGQLAQWAQALKASAIYTKAVLQTELSGEGLLANETGGIKLSPTGKALQTYYPPNEGFVIGKTTKETLQPGKLFDRFGPPTGKYGAPLGMPKEMRSLSPRAMSGEYNIYEVLKPLDATSGPAAPWFGQIGLGNQYKFSHTIEELLDLNIIRKR